MKIIRCAQPTSTNLLEIDANWKSPAMNLNINKARHSVTATLRSKRHVIHSLATDVFTVLDCSQVQRNTHVQKNANNHEKNLCLNMCRLRTFPFQISLPANWLLFLSFALSEQLDFWVISENYIQKKKKQRRAKQKKENKVKLYRQRIRRPAGR